MPPKKNEEPVQEDTNKNINIEKIRANVIENEDGELLCCEIMQGIVTRAEEEVLKNYFDRTAIPYTVQSVCKELLDLIQFVFVARDAGDISPEDNSSWQADEEPQPCPTDTWARGAIPVRRRVADPESRKDLATPGKGKRREDAKRSTPNLQQSQQQNLISTAATVSESSKTKSSVINKRNTVIPKDINRQPLQGTTQPEEEVATTHKNEHRKRTEIKEASERQSQLLREIKSGKEFTVDAINGKVIPIKPVDPKRLPTKRLDIKFDIDTGDQPLKGDDRRQSLSNITVKPPQNLVKKKGRREDRSKWSEHIQPEDTHGPLIVGASPSGGVTLREGDSTQRNELKNPKGKVSRTEYKKILDAMGVSREAVDMSANTPAQVDKNLNSPKSTKPNTKDNSEKPAAGPAAQAVLQQQPPRSGTGGGSEKQVTVKPTGGPETLKPQGIAPIPAHKNNPPAPGNLNRTKGGRNRPSGNASSPRSSDRPPPLPPNLYQSMPSMVNNNTNEQRQQPSGAIHISADLEGNEIAEDLFNSLNVINNDYNQSYV